MSPDILGRILSSISVRSYIESDVSLASTQNVQSTLAAISVHTIMPFFEFSRRGRYVQKRGAMRCGAVAAKIKMMMRNVERTKWGRASS